MQAVESLAEVRKTKKAALNGGASAAAAEAIGAKGEPSRPPVIASIAGRSVNVGSTPIQNRLSTTTARSPYKINEGEDGGDEGGEDAEDVCQKQGRSRRKRKKASEKRKLARGQIGLCTEVSERYVIFLSLGGWVVSSILLSF